MKETPVIQNQDVNQQLRLELQEALFCSSQDTKKLEEARHELQEAQQTIRDQHAIIQDLKGN